MPDLGTTARLSAGLSERRGPEEGPAPLALTWNPFVSGPQTSLQPITRRHRAARRTLMARTCSSDSHRPPGISPVSEAAELSKPRDSSEITKEGQRKWAGWGWGREGRGGGMGGRERGERKEVCGGVKVETRTGCGGGCWVQTEAWMEKGGAGGLGVGGGGGGGRAGSE